jgi:endoglucanase
MKKKILALLLVITAALTMLPLSASSNNNFTPVTGWQMMQRLGLGINIGNTLEARPWDLNEFTGNTMDIEGMWGTARIERWHFRAIKQKGFTNVRIPVSWEPHMNRNLEINREWLDRVQQCVDWALAEGLIVTLNTHHESRLYDLMNDGRTYDEARNWLFAVWTQLADRFKDYPETLIFEPMNEPRPGADGWYWDYERFATEIPILSRTANRLNHDVLELIRNSGGNNARRVVALTITQADPNLLYLYDHPNDPYTMVGVFFYPGGRANYAQERNALEQIKTALDKRIPVVIKETSPLSDTMTDTQRLAWSRFAYGELAELGVPPMWWNCTGDSPEELFDRATGIWNRAQVEALFTAYGRTPGADFPVPPVRFPFELIAPYKENEFTFWNPPRRELINADIMVVEYDTAFTGGVMFTRFSSEWVQFVIGDDRVSTEPGKIIFDIRGLDGSVLGFAAWGEGNAAKIKRVYLDALNRPDEAILTAADALTVLKASVGLLTLTPAERELYGLGSGDITVNNALEVLRSAVGL